MFISFLLIIIGVVFLLKNVGIIAGDVWGIIWPIVLIILGLRLFLKIGRFRLFWDRVWKKLE